MTPRIYYFSLFLILGGCVAKVPAPPAAETLEVPEQFMHSGNVTISLSTSSPTAWWEVYQDSKLNALETEAVHHNATLAKAYAHVHEARALRDMATGGREPELSAHLSGQLAGQTEERSIPGSSRTYRVSGDSYRSSLNVSYELDLWGRVKLTLESVEAQLAASEADQRSVALAISCEVAQSWLTLRILASENLILSEHQQCCR